MIPNKVNVAGIGYEVKEIENLADDYELGGQVIYSRGLIKVDSGMCKDKKEQIFVHELLHAIFVEAGYHDHEEETVTRLSTVLYQVLKDNKLYFGS